MNDDECDESDTESEGYTFKRRRVFLLINNLNAYV